MPPTENREQIGTATMEADRTIVLNLRADGPNGMRGLAQRRYPVGSSNYEAILEHIGAIEPGMTVPVAPWPEAE